MLKTMAIVVVVLIAGVLLYAATKPDTFRIQRAASINAPPEKVFALINDFNQWGAWSPWEKKDPAMKRMIGPATSGRGAVYEWEGDKNVGQGRMQIVESVPPSEVAIALDFVKPFEAHNIVEFTLEPTGDSTNVTWAMWGDTPYFGKILHVFINMDRMVGKDFEAGLANLKAAAEK
jgi:uncharacterized protein YndB with AHSA1/START domain